MKKKRALQYPWYWDQLDERTIEMLNNGCGPAGWKGKVVPDQIHGKDIKPACKIHDVEFGLAMTPFKKCNKRFKSNVKACIWNQSKSRFEYYITLARVEIYYSFVKGGREYYGAGITTIKK